jgi:hypothetical protein
MPVNAALQDKTALTHQYFVCYTASGHKLAAVAVNLQSAISIKEGHHEHNPSQTEYSLDFPRRYNASLWLLWRPHCSNVQH